jgi:acyl-CoA dehydrogenase
VPAENLIGEEGAGFKTIMLNFNDERLGMASSCASFSRVCLDEAIAHARERHTFGKPLSEHQGEHQVIRHKLVDMAQRVAATQALFGNADLAHRMAKTRSRISAC